MTAEWCDADLTRLIALSRVFRLHPEHRVERFDPVDRLSRLNSVDRFGRLNTVDRVSRLPGLRVLDRFGCQRWLGILGPCPLVHPGLEIHRLCRTAAPPAVGLRPCTGHQRLARHPHVPLRNPAGPRAASP